MAIDTCLTDEIGVWITPARRCQSRLKRNPNGYVGSQSLEVVKKKQNNHGPQNWSKFINEHCTHILLRLNQLLSYWLNCILQEKMIAYIREFCENEEDEIYHKFINKITGKPIGSSIKKQ